jgi:NADH-quinone oxidoreductase subunit B
LIALHKKIESQSLSVAASVPWYGAGPNEAIPVPMLGPDIIDPRQMELFRKEALKNHQTPTIAEALGYTPEPAHA